MAWLGGISKSVKFLQKRIYPLCVHPFGDHKDDIRRAFSPKPSTTIKKVFPKNGVGSVMERQCYHYQPFVLLSYRYMSSEVDGGEIMESVAINNLLAHFINAAHSISGLNWCAEIGLATALTFGLIIVPIDLYDRKSSANMKIVGKKLSDLEKQMKTKGFDSHTISKKLMEEKILLEKKHGVNPIMVSTLYVVRYGVFCASTATVLFVAAHIPSFTTGGVLWFTDLTARDGTLFLPILTSMVFWTRVQLYLQPGNSKVINVICTLGLAGPMQYFGNGILCYWFYYNFIALGYELAMKEAAIWKLLGVPPPEEKENKN